MTEPQMNLHHRNCLAKAADLTADHTTEDMTSDTMKIRDDHHLPYIGDFPPDPASRKDVSCK